MRNSPFLKASLLPSSIRKSHRARFDIRLLNLALASLIAPGSALSGQWDCQAIPGGTGWNCKQLEQPAEPDAAADETGDTAALADEEHAGPAPAAESAVPPDTPTTTPSATRTGTPSSINVPAAAPVSPAVVARDPGPPADTPAGSTAEDAISAVPDTRQPGRSGPRQALAGAIDGADTPAAGVMLDDTPVSTDIDAGIDWNSCPVGGDRLPSIASPDIDSAGELPVIIDADQVIAGAATGQATFIGDVQVIHGDLKMRSDSLLLNRLTREADASGRFVAVKPDFRIAGSAAHYQLATRTAQVENAEYRLTTARARGHADSAELLDDGRSRYRNISYTTCRPGNDEWLLTADALELDHDEGLGTADDAGLRFFGVPLLYAPTMTFPIDDRRRSGVLLPSVGYGNKTGVDIAVPYYFNLAENYDLTVTPRLMSRRGLMLGGEFRYLTESSRGELEAELLPHDSEYEGDNDIRGAIGLRHRSQFSDRSRGDIRFGHVSDNQYLEDLGESLVATSATHIEQAGELRYSAPTWSLLGRVQRYQTIDDAIARSNRPYARLPQVRFNLRDANGIGGTTYHLDAEYVNFHRDDSVGGQRIDLFPAISLPMREIWGYVTPKIGARYTGYQLTDQAAGQSDSPSSASGLLSVDSGLFFERATGYFGTAAIQTLEPRFFYLNVPSGDQGDQPVFDSAAIDFSFGNLFRENRYSGADRFADANQATLALTSRYLSSSSGAELLRASIGQIYYFDDRDVTLPGERTATDSTSPVVAELSARLGQGWRATGGIEWDPHEGSNGNVDQALAQLTYRGTDQRAFNAAYRLRDGEVEQTDVAFAWPVGPQVRLVGRHNYSLLDNRMLEAIAGIEYRRCCWRVRTLLHSYSSGTDDDHNLGFLLQLELNGLGRIGNDIEDILERSIYSYR